MFDHVLVMDRSNLPAVLDMDKSWKHRQKVQLFRTNDPHGTADVPDLYYNGGCEHEYAMLERTAAYLLSRLIDRYGLARQEGAGAESLHVREVL